MQGVGHKLFQGQLAKQCNFGRQLTKLCDKKGLSGFLKGHNLFIGNFG